MSAITVLINGWMKPSGLGERNLQGILFLVNGFFHVTSDEMVIQLHFHLVSFFLSDGENIAGTCFCFGAHMVYYYRCHIKIGQIRTIY